MSESPTNDTKKHFTGWQALFLSFFSQELYRDVARNWGGIAFLYLLLLIAGVSAFQAIRFQGEINKFVDKYATDFIQQLPKVCINKGELSIDKPSPYYVKSTDGKVAVIFDTREKKDIKNPETGEPLLVDADSITPKLSCESSMIVATKNDLISWDGRRAKITSLQGINNVELEASTINLFVQGIRKWAGIGFWSIMVPLLFCLHAIQVLIYALIAKIMANVMKADLNYQQLVRLSVIAITPVIIIDTIIHLLDQITILRYWPFVAIIATVLYLFLGVKANSQKKIVESAT